MRNTVTSSWAAQPFPLQHCVMPVTWLLQIARLYAYEMLDAVTSATSAADLARPLLLCGLPEALLCCKDHTSHLT